MASFRERKDAAGKSRWTAYIRLKGQEPETRTFDRKTDARAWAEDTERLIKAGRYRIVDESQRRTFSELCKLYSETYIRRSRAKDYGQILAWWEARMGHLVLINVTSAIIQKHLDALMASPKNARMHISAPKNQSRYATPVHQVFGFPQSGMKRCKTKLGVALTSVGTGLRYLAVLSRVLNVAVDKLLWLPKSPVSAVQRPERDTINAPRVLTPKEEKELLALTDSSENRALNIVVRIALRTGMRLNEIMRLRWNDVEFHDGHALLLIRKTKNKRQRIVPLAGDALNAVVRLRVPHVEGFSDALLFPGKKSRERPLVIRTAWKTCLKHAGIANFRFHDLRHTFASRLAGQNFSLPRIGNVLGHVDHRSTQIYTHFASDEAVQMVQLAAQASAAAISRL